MRHLHRKRPPRNALLLPWVERAPTDFLARGWAILRERDPDEVRAVVDVVEERLAAARRARRRNRAV